MDRVEVWVTSLRAALEPLADPADGAQMQRYMKDVSPFLGVKTPPRRTAVRAVTRDLPAPDPPLLREVSLVLWAQDAREYQYAACDLLGRFRRLLPADFLSNPVQGLLTTKPWWDTVDALGSAVVGPLTAAHPELVAVMWRWCRSGDRWLVRAAVQHQRGRGESTDVDRLLAMCEPHATDPEFFVAKAVGWALRDASRWFPQQVAQFVEAHPDLSRVARTEAVRGLSRAVTGPPAAV